MPRFRPWARELTETWHLTEDLVAPWLRVADRAKHIDLRKGQNLYEQGDVSPYFWFLTQGEMKVFMTRPDGEEIVVDVFGPTSLCGDGPALVS